MRILPVMISINTSPFAVADGYTTMNDRVYNHSIANQVLACGAPDLAVLDQTFKFVFADGNVSWGRIAGVSYILYHW